MAQLSAKEQTRQIMAEVRQKAQPETQSYCEMIYKVIELYSAGKPLAHIFCQDFVSNENLVLLSQSLSRQWKTFDQDQTHSTLRQEKKRFIQAAIKAVDKEIERRGIEPEGLALKPLAMKGNAEDLAKTMTALSDMNRNQFFKKKKV